MGCEKKGRRNSKLSRGTLKVRNKPQINPLKNDTRTRIRKRRLMLKEFTGRRNMAKKKAEKKGKQTKKPPREKRVRREET